MPDDWQLLSVFLAEHPEVLPPRDSPLRAGQPVGPHRPDMMLGSLRRELIETLGMDTARGF